MSTVIHELKTEAVYWDAVAAGKKTFEVRRNDRGFQPGDIVKLVRMESRMWRDTMREPLVFRIGWLLQGGQFGVEPGYCVFNLLPVEDQP